MKWTSHAFSVLARADRPLDIHEITVQINEDRKNAGKNPNALPADVSASLSRSSALHIAKSKLSEHDYPFPYRSLKGSAWFLRDTPVGRKILGARIVLVPIPMLSSLHVEALHILQDRHPTEFAAIVDDLLTRRGLPELNEDTK